MEKLILEPINFSKFLTCNKCNMIIENPYESECCGILFCYSCIEPEQIGKEKELCRKCQKNATYRQNSFLKRIINQMNIPCGFNCLKILPSNEIKSHMISCELREYVCNICLNNNRVNNKCDQFSGRKKEFTIHLLQEHENEILNFNDNFESIKLNQIEAENKKKIACAEKIEEIKENSYRRESYPGFRYVLDNIRRVSVLSGRSNNSYYANNSINDSQDFVTDSYIDYD